MKIAVSSPEGLKTLWEKEKLLVTSSFSFSHRGFERLVQQTGKKPGLVWERVNTTELFNQPFLFPGPLRGSSFMELRK